MTIKGIKTCPDEAVRRKVLVIIAQGTTYATNVNNHPDYGAPTRRRRT
jgi:hypothetical protein